MIFIGSMCGQLEPRKLKELLVKLVFPVKDNSHVFFPDDSLDNVEIGVVRLSTLSCSNTKPGLSMAIGIYAHHDKDTKFCQGITAHRCGEDISFLLRATCRRKHIEAVNFSPTGNGNIVTDGAITLILGEYSYYSKINIIIF